MKVVLIANGAGNLHSVANALRTCGAEPAIAGDPAGLADATHLSLPGVGSFGDSMCQLAARGLVEPLCDWVAVGRLYLGICLGYQLLFESSDESPGVDGLGLIAGRVRSFAERPGLKIPHMGWNAASPRHPDAPRWAGLGAEPYFYFMHSYFPEPADDAMIAAEMDYGGIRFTAAIARGALFACQFHPEKSQQAGLRLIRNFLGHHTHSNQQSAIG